MIILLLSLSGTIYCIYLLRRNEEVCKTKCEMINYTFKISRKAIYTSSAYKTVDSYNAYWDFFDNSTSYNKLLFDFRINLNKFKENFIKEIDELYERNK